MIQFETLTQLNNAFMSGDFKLDAHVTVEGVSFTLVKASPITVLEGLKGQRPVVLYVSQNSNKSLVFGWESTSRNTLRPSGVAMIEGIPLTTNESQLIVEVDGEKITIRQDQLVGDLVKVEFHGLSSPKELVGKVDTGATVSSLHADSYQINGPSISFKCTPLSDNIITIPLKAKHAVKSPDGGTVYRPVIELDVKVNGKLISGVEFNLNDRAHMDQPVLVGQNLLQAGKFYVDPTIKEHASEFDWDLLQEAVHSTSTEHLDNEIASFYKFMLESDITFKDLVHHIKHQVIKSFDDEQ